MEESIPCVAGSVQYFHHHSVMLKKSVNPIIGGTAEQAVRARSSAYTTAYDSDTIWLYL